MDIFRTREVYKRIKKDDTPGAKQPIVPVRGLYVVGDWKVPEYHNPCIMITDIQTAPLKVVDFSTKEETISAENVVRFLRFAVNPEQPILTRYSIKQEEHKEHVVRFLRFAVNPEIQITRYGRQYVDQSEHVVRFLRFAVNPEQPTFVKYYKLNVPNLYDSCLRIRNINISPCEITDG